MQSTTLLQRVFTPCDNPEHADLVRVRGILQGSYNHNDERFCQRAVSACADCRAATHAAAVAYAAAELKKPFRKAHGDTYASSLYGKEVRASCPVTDGATTGSPHHKDTTVHGECCWQAQLARWVKATADWGAPVQITRDHPTVAARDAAYRRITSKVYDRYYNPTSAGSGTRASYDETHAHIAKIGARQERETARLIARLTAEAALLAATPRRHTVWYDGAFRPICEDCGMLLESERHLSDCPNATPPPEPVKFKGIAERYDRSANLQYVKV